MTNGKADRGGPLDHGAGGLASGEFEIGPVEIGPVAHGGHCVARHEGRVVFVRHALPGELVTVRLTDTSHDAYWRGDAVEVHRADPHRVAAPCPISGPGGCGGCDLQHVAPSHQVEWKRQVVAEQLQHLAGIEWDGTVETVAPGPADRGWRTRMRWFGDPDGRWGLRRHRSHDVVPLPPQGCGISLVEPPSGGGGVADVAVDADGTVAVALDGEQVSGPDTLRQSAADRTYRVAPDGFWQVHPAAADTLVAAVLDGLRPQQGERAFDLYCGVGLFAGALTDRGVRVQGVEGSAAAVAHARHNVPQGRFRPGRVERMLRGLPRSCDLVVLDPPRKGAGRAVMRGVLERRPRAIAYVACDPAALARDLRTVRDAGWRVTSIRAFDLFPMTHHVECVAIIDR